MSKETNSMNQKPILFSTPMVKAILKGIKSQTRRVIKPQPDKRGLRTTNILFEDWHGNEVKPKYQIGDILWVRETWVWEGDTKYTDIQPIGMFFYKADFTNDDAQPSKWKPSIFMPREACRLFLEVTNIRVGRLQYISEEDAMAEGILLPNYAEEAIKDVHYPEPSAIYAALWESINGKKYPWLSNPWVWVYDFKPVKI